MDSFTGKVRRVLFRNETFHILAVEVNGVNLTVKGHLFGLIQVWPGVRLQFMGEWITDPKYGRQFQMSSWRPKATSQYNDVQFMGGCVGLDEDVSSLVWDAFGETTFQVLSDTPDQALAKFPGNSAVESLVQQWAAATSTCELFELFGDQALTASQLQGIFVTFGAEARKALEANPYELVRVPDFPFTRIDTLAQKMGLSSTHPLRYEGAVQWALREASRNGHLCLPLGVLGAYLQELRQNQNVEPFTSSRGLGVEMVEAVDRLVARKAMVLDPQGVYLPQFYTFEREAAKRLAQFLTPLSLPVDVETFIPAYEALYNIHLSVEQRQAVTELVRSKVLVITGQPGTGKTTVVRTLVALFQEAGLSLALMAPTGIAAKRLAAVTGHDAGTIHRTLRYNGQEWGFGGADKFPVGAVIIDESSMIDQELFFRVVDALDPSTVLVLVGDEQQLPSVGPGSVLRELAACGTIPTVRLTQIFRQKDTSDIVLNSHRINRGEGIETTKGKDSEFQFVRISDEDKMRSLIVQMAQKLKDRDANFQVLTPKYDGAVGVTALNEALREALNPPDDMKPEFVAGDFRVRVGDRLMVIQNDYERNVYNGDVGKLIGIDRDVLTVKIHGTGAGGIDSVVEFPRKDAFLKLKLAYAVTIHKCQGNEFDTVILPITRTQGRMLQRNLLYTAVTRAKKRVWLLGDPVAVSKAIANDKVVRRQTALGLALTDAYAALQASPEAPMVYPNEQEVTE